VKIAWLPLTSSFFRQHAVDLIGIDAGEADAATVLSWCLY